MVDMSASLDRSSMKKLRPPSLEMEWQHFSGNDTVKPASWSHILISCAHCFTSLDFPWTLWMLSLLELWIMLELMEEEAFWEPRW